MTGWLLTGNNISSGLLVLVCWWLTHSYSSRGFPSGKIVAGLWALIGVNVLLTAIVRNVDGDPRGVIVASKFLLVMLGAAYVHRLHVEDDLREDAAFAMDTTRAYLNDAAARQGSKAPPAPGPSHGPAHR